MKNPIKPAVLPSLVLGLGGLSLACLTLLYTFGKDSYGLLRSGHPLASAVFILTAIAVALVGLSTRHLGGSVRYGDYFTASVIGGVGSFLAAAGIFATTLSTLLQPLNPISAAVVALGVLSAAGLILAGISRIQGRRPFFLCHGIVCLFFAMHLVCRYRVWSADPQLLDYGFGLCACVALMLYSYHHTAFNANSGSRKAALFSGLMALYLCCAALASGETVPLYLGCGAWVMTNLRPLAAGKRRRPAQTPEGEA